MADRKENSICSAKQNSGSERDGLGDDVQHAASKKEAQKLDGLLFRADMGPFHFKEKAGDHEENG